MSWQAWVLLAWFAFEAIVGVTRVGQEREPLTAELAACNVAVWLIAGVLVVTS